MQFKVHGSGKNLYGDGIAFWYTRERMQMGRFTLQVKFTVALFLPNYTFDLLLEDLSSAPPAISVYCLILI